MITQISIKNFALAEQLRIEFRRGLNIITGETGAGKSVLVGAIAAVLGGRVFAEVVRTGFEKAHVEAIFDISGMPALKTILAARGIEPADELVMRREIAVKGNSRGFVNDVAVTITTLAEIGQGLIDIHGQHEHQSLLRKETHRTVLDLLGCHDDLLGETSDAYTKLSGVIDALSILRKRQVLLAERYELHDFQYREIEAAGLSRGEEELLSEEHKRLANVEKLTALSTKLSDIFEDGDNGLLSAISEAGVRLKELKAYSSDLEKLFEEFASARIVFEECYSAVARFQSQLEFDPERLTILESRLQLITRLKKKYGESIAAILDYQAEILQNLKLKDNFESEIQTLENTVKMASEHFRQTADRLSAARHETAARMARQVEEQLTYLGMPRMKFEARIERVPDPNGLYQAGDQRFSADKNGIDRIEFYISPNPGEKFKPLSKIASGGEISRIMLALKTILAEIDEIPILIFDEIDSGVSGRIAQAVGRSIHQLSENHQILCITHLAQIASYGNAHYSVEKYVEEERTYTRITALDENERVVEIARLIGGQNISDIVLESARQLIREGKEG